MLLHLIGYQWIAKVDCVVAGILGKRENGTVSVGIMGMEEYVG